MRQADGCGVASRSDFDNEPVLGRFQSFFRADTRAWEHVDAHASGAMRRALKRGRFSFSFRQFMWPGTPGSSEWHSQANRSARPIFRSTIPVHDVCREREDFCRRARHAHGGRRAAGRVQDFDRANIESASVASPPVAVR